MKKKVLGGIGVVVLAAICICIFLLSGVGGKYYYTQVDNSKIGLMEPDGGVIDFSGGMDFAYALPAYDADGNAKDITFGTTRELREGAFLRLKTAPIRGVVEWKEVQYEELPEPVQSKYDAAEQ